MASHHILIADHEPVVADLVKSLLKQDGYATTVVYSSADAIQQGPIVRPELVIIDPVMPGTSGVEAATRIARGTTAKILFLTTLHADRDFKEALKGLRQQGFDCGTLPKPFTKDQLLSYVRREIGPVILLTDASNVQETRRAEARPLTPRPTTAAPRAAAPAAAAARKPLSDYEPLFAFCDSRTYVKNAFRITGLCVDATLREVAKEAEKLEMAHKLGLAPQFNGFFPLSPSPDAATIRSAFQALKEPEQRLLHEFFWFWPIGRSSSEDPALSALRQHKYDGAVSIWRESEKADRTGTTAHNLAVYYHLAALEGEAQKVKTDGAWQLSYQWWGRLINDHACWDRVVLRIKEVGDPRLTIGTAERIWFSLPESLLTINARLAVAAAERGDFEEAGRQRRLMLSSGLPTDQVVSALRRALAPVKAEIERLCSDADAEARGNPKAAASVVRKLFNDKKRLLQAFNYLLGSGDPMRDVVFDLVAQAGRSGLVVYANETEDWATAQMLFEECLALSESKALRARLEEDLDIIGGNLTAQRSPQSSQAEPRPAPTSPARNQHAATPAPSVPSSHPSRAGAWVVAAIIGFFVIMGMIKGCGEDSTSSRTTRPSYTAPTSTSSDNQSTPSSYSSAAGAEVSSDGGNWQANRLKAEIESARAQLRGMQADLRIQQETLDGYQSQIDSDKARLRQMERDNQLGLSVDESEYEVIRQRHNNTVQEYNEGAAAYNLKLSEYRTLLRTTNEKVDQYNTLVKSR